MSTPASTPSAQMQKRVISSPRTAQDLKLRLGSGDISSGPYGLAMVPSFTELIASSPSQLQPLAPLQSPAAAWTLNSAHHPSYSKAGVNGTAASTTPASTSAHGGGSRLTKAKVPPPALDLVSPTALRRYSGSGNNRSSLPEMSVRKDGASSSVDVSTERCALSPSSLGGGRSSAFTPTFDAASTGTAHTTHNTPQRNASVAGSDSFHGTGGATATAAAVTMTPPPVAPRSYARRSGGSRDGAVPPPPRPSLGSGQRSAGHHAASTTATPATTTGSSSSSKNNTVDGTGRHPSDGDVSAAERAAEVSPEYNLPCPHRCLPDEAASPPIGSGRTQQSSAKASPPLALNAPVESILATSAQSSSSTNVAATPTAPGGRTSDNRTKASRAPRLACHLFLEGAATAGGSNGGGGAGDGAAAPSPGLLSPAVKSEERRRKRRSAGNTASGGGVGQGGGTPGQSRLRSSRGSSDGRVSMSTDSSLLPTSPGVAAGRPTAQNFARGELIGKGSFGAVYRGMQRSTNRIICMKEIRLPGVIEQLEQQQQQKKTDTTSSTGDAGTKSSPATQNPLSAVSAKEKATLLKQMEGVKRELALLKQLSHPNIVKYLNDEIIDGQLRIYMEYVSGGSVASAVKTYGPFEEPQAAALCFQLLQGLRYLHSRGIVHRDLKGDNLLLETSSELKIADFGTAKSIIASATMTANIVGTAYFMAPEVLRPEGLAGTPADIWAAACCVIEMLTGKPPLSNIPNQYSVMMTIAASPTVPLDKYIPADNAWSAEVVDFVTRCLCMSPSSRPTAEELLQHPWIRKHCDTDRLLSASPATTLTSAATPTISPVERPHVHSAPQRDHLSLPTSPDAPATTATPNFALSGSSPTKSPRMHNRSSGSSNTPRDASGAAAATPAAAGAGVGSSRERKSKRDKRSGSSKRHHSRDPQSNDAGFYSSGNNNNNSNSGDGASCGSTTKASRLTPPNVVVSSTTSGAVAHQQRGGRRSEPQTDGAVLSSLGSHGPGPLSRPSAGDSSRGKTHYTSGPSSLGMREEDRQQSFSYDFPSPSMRGGLGETPTHMSTTFLPAISGASSNAINAFPSNSPVAFGVSLDGARSSRLTRHGGTADSSREVTRAYHYPNDDDFTSRGSMRGGKDYAMDTNDFCRDVTDGTVRYGSTLRIPLLETGMELGMYSAVDCLRAPALAEDAQSSSSTRRSVSKRTGRSGQ